jgi:hypothetical protein
VRFRSRLKFRGIKVKPSFFDTYSCFPLLKLFHQQCSFCSFFQALPWFSLLLCCSTRQYHSPQYLLHITHAWLGGAMPLLSCNHHLDYLELLDCLIRKSLPNSKFCRISILLKRPSVITQSKPKLKRCVESSPSTTSVATYIQPAHSPVLNQHPSHPPHHAHPTIQIAKPSHQVRLVQRRRQKHTFTQHSVTIARRWVSCQTGLPTSPGQVSRLSWTGATWMGERT